MKLRARLSKQNFTTELPTQVFMLLKRYKKAPLLPSTAFGLWTHLIWPGMALLQTILAAVPSQIWADLKMSVIQKW